MPSESFRRQREEMKKNVPRSVFDYSGHIPEPSLRALPRTFDPIAFQDAVSQGPVVKSPIQTAIDDILDQVAKSREELLMKLIKDPGIVATFGEHFIVEFDDIQMESDFWDGLDQLNEYRFNITQQWRIRRKEEDGPAGTSLGRDSRGEEAED